MGFEIEASHHEVAPGQHEIDFKYADALTACDNIQTFKLVVKTIARKHGFTQHLCQNHYLVLMVQECTVTFHYSKVKKMHSLIQNGDLELSETASQFIAGMIKTCSKLYSCYKSNCKLL